MLFDNGRIKCFGFTGSGSLGYEDFESRGDEPGEMGANLPFVDLGLNRTVLQVDATSAHSCVLLDNAGVKCFGSSLFGNLGYGDTISRGANPGDMGDNLPFVDFGTTSSKVIQVDGTGVHTCMLFDNGKMKCFGQAGPQLGYEDFETRGDEPDEMGDNLSFVDLGSHGYKITQISTAGSGGAHTCALFENGKVKCFGNGFFGQLGYGDQRHRGSSPGDMGDNLPFINFGNNQTVIHISCGNAHTCVILQNGGVKCIGNNRFGGLGYGDTENRGNRPTDMGDNLSFVDFGNTNGSRAIQLSSSVGHTCALFDNGKMKCFGAGFSGALGTGDENHRGDDPGEMGDALPFIDFGSTERKVVQMSTGGSHNCAVFDDGSLKCFGQATNGALGYGDTENRGDEPGEMGDNLPFVDFTSTGSPSKSPTTSQPTGSPSRSPTLLPTSSPRASPQTNDDLAVIVGSIVGSLVALAGTSAAVVKYISTRQSSQTELTVKS